MRFNQVTVVGTRCLRLCNVLQVEVSSHAVVRSKANIFLYNFSCRVVGICPIIALRHPLLVWCRINAFETLWIMFSMFEQSIASSFLFSKLRWCTHSTPLCFKCIKTKYLHFTGASNANQLRSYSGRRSWCLSPSNPTTVQSRFRSLPCLDPGMFRSSHESTSTF